MNRTFSINLGGTIFHIEEGAFEKLKNYLDSLKLHFSKTEGREEIISDIELRLAEIFQERIKGKREAVLAEDVEYALKSMGSPGDFDNTETGPEKEVFAETVTGKRLFRNPDDRLLGGVCSGISAYFNLGDPLWLRLAFVLFFFFGFGGSLIIYLILWVLVPEAKNAAEKLQMRGESVTVENIERNIKREFEHVKTKFGTFQQEAKNFNPREYYEKHPHIGSFMNELAIIIKKLVGVLLIFIGVVILIALVAAILGLTGVIHSDHALLNLVFDNSLDKILTAAAIILIGAIPLIAIIMAGFEMLLKVKRPRYVGRTFLTVWLISLGVLIFEGVKTGSAFASEGMSKETLTLSGDKLYVDLKNHNMDNFEETDHFTRNGDNLLLFGEDSVAISNVNLNIIASEDSSFHLIQHNISRGKNRKQANEFARRINFQAVQQDSVLLIDPYIFLPKGSKWNNQRVKLTFKVPMGKEFILNKSLKTLWVDMENIHDLDGDEVTGRTWIREAGGMRCLDCPPHIENMQRPKETVEINAGGAHIKVSSH